MLAISWIYVCTGTERERRKKTHTPTLGSRNVGDCQRLQCSLKTRGYAVRKKKVNHGKVTVVEEMFDLL